MPVKPSVVVNSSPLIALVAALPDFDLLGEIVERCIVPAEVIAELNAGGQKDETAARVLAARWCEVRSERPVVADPLVPRLGASEAAVIQTAVVEGLPHVVIDEVRGRRAARLAGLRVLGSLGLLVELHRARLLPSIEESIQRMQRKGIFLAPHLIQMTLAATRN